MLLAALAFFAGPRADAAEAVPFVGCAGDGQVGPVKAPRGKPQQIDADPATAAALAFYQASDFGGVLAPKGWRCFYWYGSSGASLIVSPNPRDFAAGARTKGPAVVLTVSDAETSGRFAVAMLAARLFPDRRDFVEGVIAEGLEPREDFPYGPYPDDKLTYRDADTVEFETPAGKDGIGTTGLLEKSDLPVRGRVAISDAGATVLRVRLPADLAGLFPTIATTLK